jgi:hypothetical protein
MLHPLFPQDYGTHLSRARISRYPDVQLAVCGKVPILAVSQGLPSSGCSLPTRNLKRSCQRSVIFSSLRLGEVSISSSDRQTQSL